MMAKVVDGAGEVESVSAEARRLEVKLGANQVTIKIDNLVK